MSTARTLDYAVYRLDLPSGGVEVIIASTARSVGGALLLLLLTEIVIDRLDASEDDVEALKARVSPHLQLDWSPHCRTDSWTGACFGGYECAHSAIEALGNLRLVAIDGGDPDEYEVEVEERLQARTYETMMREVASCAHEGMVAQAIGRKVDSDQSWALEHAYAL